MHLPAPPPPIKRRLLLLLFANLILLASTFVLLKEGGSISSVLLRLGPNIAPIVLAGIGLTGIIWTGAIDLSIGSIISVSGTIFGVAVVRGVPPLAAFTSCVATAFLLSMLNGVVIRALRIPAIIVTLAGLPIYRGVSLLLAEWAIPQFTGNISVTAERYHAPGKIHAWGILLTAVLAAILLESFSRAPRHWLALGSSKEACSLLGLNPGRIQQTAFGVGGLFLGLAALLYVTRIQAIEPARMALGFELQVIGAVILGGTNIFGGEGSYLGTILGAMFLYLIVQVLVYAGASPYFQDAITGAIIIGVIGTDCALNRRRKQLEELS